MIKAFPRLLRRDNYLKNGFFTVANFIKSTLILRNSSYKLLSSGRICFQYGKHNNVDAGKRQLPNIFYIQNPITWLINKIDFIMLKNAWDPEFDEKEFKRGVRQAVSVITTLISENQWSSMKGLITTKALTRLQRDVEMSWNEELKELIMLQPSDIKLILPRKVHFLRIADQKFVDVDVICVGMKFKGNQFADSSDIVLIETLVRFHRNYTAGQIPRWIVTLFKLNKDRTLKNYHSMELKSIQLLGLSVILLINQLYHKFSLGGKTPKKPIL